MATTTSTHPTADRIHTDNSVEVRYYDKPKSKWLSKSAFSLTGDMGCEFGPSMTTAQGIYVQGVGCKGNTHDAKSVGGDHFAAGINPKQSFIGYMFYDRNWFDKDKFALTIGGGQINNPGRYLVLVPPINGETAASAALNSPYFSFNPSDPFKAWDTSATFDYMPRQWLTFRVEYDFRHANVPYWTGHGGITPPNAFGYTPGTNNGSPQFCLHGRQLRSQHQRHDGAGGRLLRQRTNFHGRSRWPLAAGPAQEREPHRHRLDDQVLVEAAVRDCMGAVPWAGPGASPGAPGRFLLYGRKKPHPLCKGRAAYKLKESVCGANFVARPRWQNLHHHRQDEEGKQQQPGGYQLALTEIKSTL